MSAAAAGPNFIELQGLTKVLGGQTVLDRLDLAILTGETFVILGASGSGKSVTLRHIVGLMRPDAGRVVVEGEDVTDWDDHRFAQVRRKVSFIFQSGALFDSMTVGENVAFGLIEQGRLTRAEIAARVRESLALVGLEGTEDKLPSDLSGGMRKRVSIARSMALDPECLLYDEPTAGLDPVTGFRIVELIRRNAERAHVTTVVVTHDIPAAFYLATRIGFLHGGRLRFIGTPDETRASPDPVVQEFLHAYEGKR